VIKRKLGVEGPELTRIGVGTWAVGGPYRFGWGPQGDDESVEAILHAIDSGINWIDTAAVYGLGHSEEVVGEALASVKQGGDVFVATKCGGFYRPELRKVEYDLRPESIRAECEGSLKRLRAERIDLYQFHRPDDSTGTPVEESWGTMAELINEGKVRWAGVSNFDVGLLGRCEAIRHVDSCQPPLNMIKRSAADDVIPWCREHETGVIVYSPMASGLLTGKLERARVETLPEDDWRSRSPQFRDPELSKGLALVEGVRPIARRLGVSMAELAIAWTLAVPGVTAAIAGARRPAQVDSWLSAPGVVLTEADLAEIDGAIAQAGV